MAVATARNIIGFMDLNTAPTLMKVSSRKGSPGFSYIKVPREVVWLGLLHGVRFSHGDCVGFSFCVFGLLVAAANVEPLLC